MQKSKNLISELWLEARRSEVGKPGSLGIGFFLTQVYCGGERNSEEGREGLRGLRTTLRWGDLDLNPSMLVVVDSGEPTPATPLEG